MFRDPFDDEKLDRPAIKSTRGGVKSNFPVIAAGPTICVHCGGPTDYQHNCQERSS
jgi:hypothetical protein